MNHGPHISSRAVRGINEVDPGVLSPLGAVHASTEEVAERPVHRLRPAQPPGCHSLLRHSPLTASFVVARRQGDGESPQAKHPAHTPRATRWQMAICLIRRVVAVADFYFWAAGRLALSMKNPGTGCPTKAERGGALYRSRRKAPAGRPGEARHLAG